MSSNTSGVTQGWIGLSPTCLPAPVEKSQLRRTFTVNLLDFCLTFVGHSNTGLSSLSTEIQKNGSQISITIYQLICHYCGPINRIDPCTPAHLNLPWRRPLKVLKHCAPIVYNKYIGITHLWTESTHCRSSRSTVISLACTFSLPFGHSVSPDHVSKHGVCMSSKVGVFV